MFLRRQSPDIDASIAAEDIDVGYDEESSVGITFADGSAAIDGEGATSEGGNCYHFAGRHLHSFRHGDQRQDNRFSGQKG